jgi:hypothetical protein
MHRYEAADRGEEIELQWPEPMVNKLAEFYEKTYAQPAREEWNCHTFGAQVTGNSRSIRLNGARDVANAIQGPETAPTDIENGRLSGVFTRLGHLSHTLVGTQVNGQCLHVVGRKMPLYYSVAAEWQKHYNGTIHSYTYAPREPRAS